MNYPYRVQSLHPRCGSWRPARVALMALCAPLACGGSAGVPAAAPAGSTKKMAPPADAIRVEVAVYDGATGVNHLVRPGEVLGTREARLAAALGGFVEAVLVRSGASVSRNQIIARIDSTTHDAQVSLTQIEIEDARRELDRIEVMAEAVAPARIDAARSRLLRAEAQHRLAVARAERSIVRAPFAGVVTSLALEPGEVVAPGQPIATLIVLDPVRVSVSVPGRELAGLRPGGRAAALTVGHAGRRPGRILRIEPAADRSTRTFAVEVEVPNPDRGLLPGMVVQVEFERDGLEGAVLLPQDLLVTRREDNGVFVVAATDEGTAIARWRPVKLGKVAGDQIEILAGVSLGDRLITVGQRALSDGDPVLITRAGTCCSDGRIVFTPDGNPPAARARAVP